MNNKIEVLVGNLIANEVPEMLWIYLIVNFITKLLLVVGKNVILVVYNRLSRMAYFVATTEGILVEELVILFRDYVWKLYRLPKSVISDRRLQFVAELRKELYKMLEIKIRLSIVFHSQIDEQIEYINQELK